MPAILFEPDEPGLPLPQQPTVPLPTLDDPPVPALYDEFPYLTPVKHVRRSRVPRSIGIGGLFKTPKPNLPASIFRGDDNPLSPSPDDYDEAAAIHQDDNEFDLASELALTEQAESNNQLLPPFDDSDLPHSPSQGKEAPDIAAGLLSPPQIVWKRNHPGSGMAPGPLARPESFGSPYISTGSPAPTSTVPSTPTVESTTATSMTAGMEHVETQASGANVVFNPAATPLLAASIALSVVLGVLLVGLATCGIVKSCRRKRPDPDDVDEKEPPSPSRVLPPVRMPTSRSSMTLSASPSFATAPSFHTANSASSEMNKMISTTSHPQGILITSRSAQSLAGSTHTRRISFIENPMPVNSIEDLHRQLYAPPGWQPGMPLPLAYMQAHGYQVEEVDLGEYDVYSLGSAGQGSVTWSATPLDTISEEGSHCGSDESAGGLAYVPATAEAESEQDHASPSGGEIHDHAFILPTIPSIADETLEEAMRDGLSELESQNGPDSENGSAATMSRRTSGASIASIRHDGDSTFSSAAPGTPRASTSEPSLRSLSFHSACEDVDEEALAYGVIGGYGYAYLAQRNPSGGWEIQAPTPKTPVPQKRVTIATSPTETSNQRKGKRNRRRKGNKHGKTPYPDIPDRDILDFRPESRLDFGGDVQEEQRQRSFDSVYGLSLPHEESVLGALLMLEDNDMDARRAAFSPKVDMTRETARNPSTRRVKRSKSIPARLFGKVNLDTQSTADDTSVNRPGDRSTEYFGHFKRAFRAMRRDNTGSLHLGEEIVPAPTFRRFSGADWDELDELDPYYSEAEAGDDGGSGPEDDGREADRNSRVLAHLSSHFGISEAHFALEEFDFPEPANHLPHIHVTSH